MFLVGTKLDSRRTPSEVKSTFQNPTRQALAAAANRLPLTPVGEVQGEGSVRALLNHPVRVVLRVSVFAIGVFKGLNRGGAQRNMAI